MCSYQRSSKVIKADIVIYYSDNGGFITSWIVSVIGNARTKSFQLFLNVPAA